MKRIATALIAAALVAPSAAQARTITMQNVRHAMNAEVGVNNYKAIRCDRKTAERIDCTVRSWGQPMYFDDGTSAEQVGTSLDHNRFIERRNGVVVIYSEDFEPFKVRP